MTIMNNLNADEVVVVCCKMYVKFDFVYTLINKLITALYVLSLTVTKRITITDECSISYVFIIFIITDVREKDKLKPHGNILYLFISILLKR